MGFCFIYKNLLMCLHLFSKYYFLYVFLRNKEQFINYLENLNELFPKRVT